MGFINRARCAFAVVVLLAVTATAYAQTELFPRPAELEPAVRFWTRVYTEVDTRSGFIHDSLRLDIVYATVRLGDDSPRERRRRIDRATDEHKKILNKLATGARQNLNADEERVLALFPAGTSNAEFRAAAERLRFQLGQSDRFRAGLVRSGAWKPYILETLARNGLPKELAALPHVESSFDPTAYSKVGAAGLWQFMRSTGVRYMRIDHIVDERRDPFFATDAAARLLADNYGVIQTWPLALTAYNHGLAGMRRAVQQQKTSDIATIVAKYQSRSFGFASRNFYTAFLAALDIDSNPERYFSNLKIDPPSDTDVVALPDYIAVDTLADALGVRENTLRTLNPALTDAVWAGDKLVPRGFELRLPRADIVVAAAKIASIDASQRFASQRADREHRVRRGDTLSQIAAEYRVSLAALMRVNGLSARDVIRVGQLITLPVDAGPGAVPPAAALARNESAPPAAPAAAVASTAELVADGDFYVVRSGDSIERIANRLGVTQEALLAANGIRNRNLIHAGQQLTIPGRAASEPVVVAAVAPAPATAGAAAAVVSDAVVATVALPDATVPLVVGPLANDELTAALTPAVLADGQPEAEGASALDDEPGEVNALATEQAALAADPSDYSVSAGNRITVQALETLGHYADWLNIPTQRLRDLNNLSFREAVVMGQTLMLDLSDTDAATFEQRRIAHHQQSQSEFFAANQIEDIATHVVKPGESLWLLAARTYKVPVWLLRQYNPDLNLDRVQPGAVVRFPRLKSIVPGVGEAAPQAVAVNGV